MGLHQVMYQLKQPVKELTIDFSIPDYLDHDIKEFIKAMNKKDLAVDCYMNEIQGSINMAMVSHAITKYDSDILREYYLYGGIFDECD